MIQKYYTTQSKMGAACLGGPQFIFDLPLKPSWKIMHGRDRSLTTDHQVSVLADVSPDASDEMLVELLKSGRRDAFKIVVTRYQRLVQGLARKFLANDELAREVAQEVFLTFWSDREQYQHKGLLKSYLSTVTLNRCRNMARHQKLVTKKMDTVTEQYDEKQQQIEPPDARHLSSEKSQRLRAAMDELPGEQRQVLVLRYFNEHPLDEIATLMSLPLGTVKSHVSRGLKKLHAIYREESL